MQRHDEAEALLVREYEQFKPEVLRTVGGKLAAGGARVPAADLEAFYNDAWHGLYMKLTAGEHVENRKGLLVTIAHRRALNEHRALRPGRRADPEELDALAADADIDARLDDQTRLRQLIEGMRDRLDDRQRQAAALCYLYEYSRPEAARAIGVTPKRMEKIMDGVSKQVRELVGEIEAGERCSGYASLIRAYAAGLLEEDGERHRLARNHLDSCSACRRQVLLLRGIAAVAPPAPLLVAAIPGSAGVASGPAGNGGDAATQGIHQGLGSAAKAVAASAVAAAAAVAAVAAVAVTAGDRQPAPPQPPPPPAADPSARQAAPSQPAPLPRKVAAKRRTQPSPPPAAPPPAAQPETTPVEPAPEPVATPSPEPPVPQEPVRDGAEEFELRSP